MLGFLYEKILTWSDYDEEFSAILNLVVQTSLFYDHSLVVTSERER